MYVCAVGQQHKDLVPMKSYRMNPFLSSDTPIHKNVNQEQILEVERKTHPTEQIRNEYSTEIYSPDYKISRITEIKRKPTTTMTKSCFREDEKGKQETKNQMSGNKNLSAQIHAVIMKKRRKKLKKINNGLREDHQHHQRLPSSTTSPTTTRQKNELEKFTGELTNDNNHYSAPETSGNNNAVLPSTSLDDCMLTGSCPELSQLNEFYQCYGDEFDYDANPIISRALSSSVSEDEINSPILVDLDKQIVKELELEEKFKKLSASNSNSADRDEEDDSLIFDKLIESQITSAKRAPNPGKGVKSIKEEIEEKQYFKKNLIVRASEAGVGTPQTELLWPDNDNSEINLKNSFNYKLPRTTYIEEDMDTDMQIVVNCMEDHKTGLFHRPRTKVCCVLM